MNKIRIFLSSVAVKTKEAVSRYPISIFLILLAFGILQYLNWQEGTPSSVLDVLNKVEMTIWVTLPLFTAVSLFRMRQWTFFLALLLGAAFYWMQGSTNYYSEENAQRMLLWGLAFYSTLLFLPQWKKNENNGFWVYCERLAFTLVLAGLCTLILTISLELALFSIRELFDVNLDYRWEQMVGQFGGFCFLPLFVHVGLPYEWKPLEASKDYPHFLRPVSYYLLLPLSVLYLGILTTYVVKILVTMDWPSGQVAYPVLYFSMLTFVTYFLSYPWQKSWLKYSFAVLLPFLGIYFVALFLRIDQYGLTELRYLGVLLGLLLTLLSIYYLVSKVKRLQIFFVSFASVAFLFSFGPWGIFELSVQSQVAHLENLVERIGALQDGKLQKVDVTTVDAKIAQEISGVVDYLANHDALEEVQSWTDLDLSESAQIYELRTEFMLEMGLTFDMWGYLGQMDPLYSGYAIEYGQPLDVSGYEVMFPLDIAYDTNMGDGTFSFNWNSEEDNVNSSVNKSGDLVVVYEGSDLHFDLFALKNSIDAQNISTDALSPELLTLTAENAKFRAKVVIEYLNFNFQDEAKTTLYNLGLGGKLFLDVK